MVSPGIIAGQDLGLRVNPELLIISMSMDNFALHGKDKNRTYGFIVLWSEWLTRRAFYGRTEKPISGLRD